jgi:hypothetical protein
VEITAEKIENLRIFMGSIETISGLEIDATGCSLNDETFLELLTTIQSSLQKHRDSFSSLTLHLNQYSNYTHKHILSCSPMITVAPS